MVKGHGEEEGKHLGFHRFHVENHALVRGADGHELQHHERVHLPREVEHAHCLSAADTRNSVSPLCPPILVPLYCSTFFPVEERVD